jgi:hypothetical protein
MSTAIIVEQRLPISIQLLSRISTYAHVFEVCDPLYDIYVRCSWRRCQQSVLAMFLFWLFPSLGPKMPELETVYRPRRRCGCTVSIHSIQSTASTLVDENMTTEEEDLDVEADGKHCHSTVLFWIRPHNLFDIQAITSRFANSPFPYP